MMAGSKTLDDRTESKYLGEKRLMTKIRINGKADRKTADARPSALSALIFSRISDRLRINRDNRPRILGDVSAGLGLNAQRDGQKQQILLADAAIEIVQRISHIEPK